MPSAHDPHPDRYRSGIRSETINFLNSLGERFNRLRQSRASMIERAREQAASTRRLIAASFEAFAGRTGFRPNPSVRVRGCPPELAPAEPHGLARDERLARELAAIQARADLKAAEAASEPLCAEGLRELRAWIDTRLGGENNPPRAGSELSEREAEVLRQIALGYSNKEIAARMEISVKTVETYKARAMEKLQLHSRVQIVRYAIQRGWFNNIPA